MLLMTTPTQSLDPNLLPSSPRFALGDLSQVGVAIALSFWIIRWLVQQSSGKSQRDDELLATAIRQQQAQNDRLIALVAEQQAETSRALDDLREAIDDLREVMRVGAGLPYRPIPSHLPSQSIPTRLSPERNP